jgi:hypothetical protein
MTTEERLKLATAMLREIEWAASTWGDEPTCPFCRGLKRLDLPNQPKGHSQDNCRLVEFLSHDQG